MTPNPAPALHKNHHGGLALAASGRLRSCNHANGNALIFGCVFRDGWRLAPALHDVTPDAAPSVNESHHVGLALAASGRLRSCNHANGNVLIFGCVFRDGWRLAPALHDVTPDAAPSVNENHHGGLALAASGRLRSCNHANGNALIFGRVFRDGWRPAPALHDVTPHDPESSPCPTQKPSWRAGPCGQRSLTLVQSREWKRIDFRLRIPRRLAASAS